MGSSNWKFFARALSAAAFTITTLAACGDVFVHEEFDKNTMNKSEDEVTQFAGKPTQVDANNPAHVMWTYYSKTFDVENNNKRDIKAVVIFEPDPGTKKLKVVKVEYQKG